MDDKSFDELSETIVRTINRRRPQTVEQLVALLKEENHAAEKQILEAVLKLQSQGKIKLENSPQLQSQKRANYIMTYQALWYWAAIATAIITAAVVFAVPENFYPWVYVRYLLGTIFVLWLPGYTFIKALFPTEILSKNSEKSLDLIVRVALSIGMSLALVPMVGLLLNYTPWGIRLTPIVLSLLALTIIFATAAILREYGNAMKTGH